MSNHQGPVPPREGDAAKWLPVFSRGVGKYGLTLGMSPAEVTDAQLNCAIGATVIELQDEVTDYAKSITQFKKAVLWAEGPATAWPVGYTMPANLPVTVRAGVLALIAMLVQRLKKHPAYTVDMGKEMGIEGPDAVSMAPSDLSALQPVLTVKLDTGGHPRASAKKQNTQGFELWADHADGKGMNMVAFVNGHDYVDVAPLPAPGGSAVMTYRAIYHVGGVQVGQWSLDVKISVLGR